MPTICFLSRHYPVLGGSLADYDLTESYTHGLDPCVIIQLPICIFSASPASQLLSLKSTVPVLLICFAHWAKQTGCKDSGCLTSVWVAVKTVSTCVILNKIEFLVGWHPCGAQDPRTSVRATDPGSHTSPSVQLQYTDFLRRICRVALSILKNLALRMD